MADQKKSYFVEKLVGWVVIVVVIVVALVVALAIAYRFYSSNKSPESAPVVVSLSAYFVPDTTGPEKSHIKINGDVYQGGQPVKNGTVRITVAKEGFLQSVSVPLKDGHFETEDPAFHPIHACDLATVTADVSSPPGLSETATIQLNSQSPVLKSWIEYSLLAIVFTFGTFFLYAFTGRKTPRKNRIAIRFSYVVIVLFLAVPILAPVMLLRTFPESLDDMIGVPAGLVNTQTPNQEKGQTQWALNLGGYSYIPGKPPTCPATEDKTDKTAGKTTEDKTDKTAGKTTENKTDKTAGKTTENKTDKTIGKTTEDKTDKTIGKTTEDTGKKDTTEAQSSHYGGLNPPPVKVEGGLVIPLYVIILSVIGGAINMTRKVPGFQKEDEDADSRSVGFVARLGALVMGWFVRRGKTEPAAVPTTPVDPLTPVVSKVTDQKDEPQPSLQDQAKAIGDKLEPLVLAQIQRNGDTSIDVAKIRALVLQMQDLYSKKTNDQLLGFNSYDDWFASHPRLREVLGGSWRVELLNQYMYLISAPFLAVVTYYMLDLLGLSKPGVVVVLSFSVGLISEKIVSWILGIATGYLQSNTNTKPAKAN